MEIRLIDLINNKVDVRNYMFIHEGKIMVNAQHVYDVILDTEKDRLHQQMELFDSREEMFKKAKAFDEIAKYVNKKLEEEEFPIEDDYLIGRYESYEIIEEIIKENMEDK